MDDCPPPRYKGIGSREAVAGDICLWDRVDQRKVLVPFAEYSSEAFSPEEYNPLGIVVVPGTHDVYGTGECAVIGMNFISDSSPDTGAIGSKVRWGYFIREGDPITGKSYSRVPITDDPTLPDCVITQTHSWANLPHGWGDSKPSTAVDCGYDIHCGFDGVDVHSLYAPSPYLTDGSRNPGYYQVTDPSSDQNVLSDFSGKESTSILWGLATAQSDWRTANQIIESDKEGYFPAACCCWRYCPEGTQQGDWYLPAMGEAGYISPRISFITRSFSALVTDFGLSVRFSTEQLCVTESAGSHSWSLLGYNLEELETVSKVTHSDDDEGRDDSYRYAKPFLRVLID